MGLPSIFVLFNFFDVLSENIPIWAHSLALKERRLQYNTFTIVFLWAILYPHTLCNEELFLFISISEPFPWHQLTNQIIILLTKKYVWNETFLLKIYMTLYKQTLMKQDDTFEENKFLSITYYFYHKSYPSCVMFEFM